MTHSPWPDRSGGGGARGARGPWGEVAAGGTAYVPGARRPARRRCVRRRDGPRERRRRTRQSVLAHPPRRPGPHHRRHPGVRVRLPEMLGESGRIAYVTDAEGEDAVEISYLPRATGGRAARRLASGQLGRVLELVSDPAGERLAVASHDGRLLVLDVTEPDTEAALALDARRRVPGGRGRRGRCGDGRRGRRHPGRPGSAADRRRRRHGRPRRRRRRRRRGLRGTGHPGRPRDRRRPGRRADPIRQRPRARPRLLPQGLHRRPAAPAVGGPEPSVRPERSASRSALPPTPDRRPGCDVHPCFTIRQRYACRQPSGAITSPPPQGPRAPEPLRPRSCPAKESASSTRPAVPLP
ncbi:hypothetical protein SBADM41S_01170 [Streptomyces badius]